MRVKRRTPFIVFGITVLAAALFPSSRLAGQAGTHLYGLPPQLFHTSDRCMACHNQLVAPSGEDVSIGFAWRSSMMGNAGRDPYWQAAVRRETMDHPGAVDAIEDKCTICHLAMARAQSVADGGQGRAFENYPWVMEPGPYSELAVDGVSCTVCHQITSEGLGEERSFTGGFIIEGHRPPGQRRIFGPFDVDPGRATVMRSASEFQPEQAPHIQSAEFCASCHTLYTHALGPDGEEVGELAEQVPYLEWKHSSFPGQATCQTCHMPEVEGEVAVTGVLPHPRPNVNRHTFRGGNFLMPRLLNRYRAELGVKALPQELSATASQAAENLGNRTATLDIRVVSGEVEESGSRETEELVFDVRIENLAGHKFPSAYPSRRAWLHVTVTDRSGRVVFESGVLEPDGSIRGNDNDAHAGRFEPHYREITRSEQVQIYEDIMVDRSGAVTTGLLQGVRYVKDNRLLPAGFDKATADPDVAVMGEAMTDSDFVGGSDWVRYRVEMARSAGPFQVAVELWYQPIGYRWARNLEEYDTVESARFLSYFDSMSASSAILVARREMTVQ